MYWFSIPNTGAFEQLLDTAYREYGYRPDETLPITYDYGIDWAYGHFRSIPSFPLYRVCASQHLKMRAAPVA